MTVSEEKTCPAQNGITGLSLRRYEGWKQTVVLRCVRREQA